MFPIRISQDQTTLLELTRNLTIVIILIALYWFLLDKVRRSLKSIFPKNTRLRIASDITVTLVVLIISFLTLSLAFANNIGTFFTGIGLVSTALVFALQDFVASFFGWLHIRVNHLYGINHEIAVHSNNTDYTGRVIKVGILRTNIRARLGDGTNDEEMVTGKVVSFPNHLVLKGAVDNYTKNNPVTWHTLPTTITFESDLDLAIGIITKIADRQFSYSLDHSQELTDSGPNKKTIYKPKVYVDIDTVGPKITVWFACNIGHYREVLHRYSMEILTEFGKNKIDLAYPTQRVLVER
jgi:small-conductance mechanosensitive channel